MPCSVYRYRMHLWGKMAQQQASQRQNAAGATGQLPTSASAASPSGLAGNLRPHFFAKSSTLSSLLSGKAVSSSASAAAHYPTPPNSPPLGRASASSSKADAPTPMTQQAVFAMIASLKFLHRSSPTPPDFFSRQDGPFSPCPSFSIATVLEEE